MSRTVPEFLKDLTARFDQLAADVGIPHHTLHPLSKIFAPAHKVVPSVVTQQQNPNEDGIITYHGVLYTGQEEPYVDRLEKLYQISLSVHSHGHTKTANNIIRVVQALRGKPFQAPFRWEHHENILGLVSDSFEIALG